jgi:hypothetical protein
MLDDVGLTKAAIKIVNWGMKSNLASPTLPLGNSTVQFAKITNR